MFSSTDVCLPRDRQPIFPGRCVACGAPGPEATLLVASRGLWQAGGNPLAVFRSLRRGAVHVAAPACSGCARAHRRHKALQRIFRWVGMLAIGCTIAFVMRRIDPAWTEWLGGHVEIVLALAFVLLIVVPVESMIPLAFDIAVHADTVEFEFRDAGLAAEFARLNGAVIEGHGT